jgi:hypothetical protein
MNGLYPIIRRVRRPLLPVDWPADVKPAPVPVVPARDGKSGQVEDGKQDNPAENHGEITSSEPAS